MEKALGIKLLIGAGALTLFAKKAKGNTLNPGNVVKNLPLEKQADGAWYVLMANDWLNTNDPAQGIPYKNVFLLSLQKGDPATAKDRGTKWVVSGVDAYIAQYHSGHSMTLTAIERYTLIYMIVNAMLVTAGRGGEPAPIILTDAENAVLEFSVLVSQYIQSQLQIYDSTGHSDMLWVRSEKTRNNINSKIAHPWDIGYGYSGYTGTFAQMVNYIEGNVSVQALRDHYPSPNPLWLNFTHEDKQMIILVMIEKLKLNDIIGSGAPNGDTSPMELNSLLDQAGGIGNVLKFVVATVAAVIAIIMAIPTGGSSIIVDIAFIYYLFDQVKATKKEVE